jgi:hypothetical protein
MNVLKPWMGIAALLGAVTACEAHDRLLTPDPVDSGGTGGAAGAAGAGGTSATGAGGASATGAGGTTGGGGGSGAGGSAGAGVGGTGGTGTGGAAGASGGIPDGGGDKGDGSTGGAAGSGGIADSGSDGHRPPTPQDPDCDLNGIWIAQQISVATAIGAPQYGNVWHYLEFEQNGVDVRISKQFDCGGAVKGTLNVTFRDATTRSTMAHNRQMGRRGTMKKNASGGCDVAFERFWGVRGAVEANFIPSGGRNSMADMTQVQAERPLPKPMTPAGAEDWDGDTFMGIGWDVAGAVTGRRHSVQRDWSSWLTDSAFPVTAALHWPTDIVLRAEVDLEDSVFATEPANNFLLASVATSDIRNANNRLVMRFLGRNASDPRVSAVPISGTDPVADPATALATCLAIQAALPVKQAK